MCTRIGNDGPVTRANSLITKGFVRYDACLARAHTAPLRPRHPPCPPRHIHEATRRGAYGGIPTRTRRRYPHGLPDQFSVRVARGSLGYSGQIREQRGYEKRVNRG
ncbi:hypothetical protein AMP1_48 [Burkholderia phage AMP1]|uniref:Uncharacterized protein n=1 Tax=Burkholderia phage AMP1 TaxID=2601683 RepID=A0A5C2IBT1_9CAUD|nr:hypothetical protein AMP1_48 [Burkholderia phage AMP1]